MVATVWEGEESAEGERLCLKACVWVPVSLFQCPVMPPLNLANSRSEHPGCIQGDEKYAAEVWASYFQNRTEWRIMIAAIIPLQIGL